MVSLFRKKYSLPAINRSHFQNQRQFLLVLLLLAVIPLTLSLSSKPQSFVERAAPEDKPQKQIQALPPVASDEILLKFKPGVSSEAKEKERKGNKLSLEETIPQIEVERVKVPSGEKEIILERLKRNPRVEYAEPNYTAEVQEMIPNDPYFSTNQWGPQKVSGPAAWDLTQGSEGVLVAIVDTGISANHPDLAGKVIAGYDYVNNDYDPTDDNGHGTHVAGIAGALTNNQTGIAGICWLNRLLSIKVLNSSGSGYYSWVANGIIYAADNGASVINLSLGGSSYSSTLESAVNYAWNKGVVTVAAAGNNANNAILYPARFEKVVAVASTTNTDERWGLSNYGAELDISAPGSAIYSTVLNGQYAYKSGTSMATPHVAGASGLLIAYKDLPNTAIIEALYQGADDFGDPGWDQYFGWGRLNIYQSLSKLTPLPPPPPDTTPPTVSITSPVEGAVLLGLVDIAASATDDVGVTKVEFYVDGVLLAEDQNSPYLASWDTSTTINDSHVLTAKAYDAAGNVGTATPVSVTVSNPPPDTTPPTVNITYPADGSTVRRNSNITITASATDNAGVTEVVFSVNGVAKCTGTTEPYACVWRVPNVKNVTYTLKAEAYDAAGNVSSQSIFVKSK